MLFHREIEISETYVIMSVSAIDVTGGAAGEGLP